MNTLTRPTPHTPSEQGTPPTLNGQVPVGKALKGGPLYALLLAAAVAALAVAVDRLAGSWADEHILTAWIALWSVVFAGSLLFAGTAGRMAQAIMGRLDRWALRRAQARAQARFEAMARTDNRLMADLQAARGRSDALDDAVVYSSGTVITPSDADRREWSLADAEQVDMGHGRRVNLYYI
jgi:hypothetical protein